MGFNSMVVSKNSLLILNGNDYYLWDILVNLGLCEPLDSISVPKHILSAIDAYIGMSSPSYTLNEFLRMMFVDSM